MEFEWDEKKEKKNIKGHDITFHEAATVFGDPLAITFNDPDHSIREHRFITFGNTHFDTGLVVALKLSAQEK